MCEYYSPTVAGRKLGVCGRTIRNRINDGSLPGLKIGNTYRVRADVIDQLAAEAGGE